MSVNLDGKKVVIKKKRGGIRKYYLPVRVKICQKEDPRTTPPKEGGGSP